MVSAIEEGFDADIIVTRMAPEGYEPRWYVEVRGGDGSRRMTLVDKARIETMAALVPIELVQHVQSIREEMAAVFALHGFEEGVARLVPFENLFRVAKPS